MTTVCSFGQQPGYFAHSAATGETVGAVPQGHVARSCNVSSLSLLDRTLEIWQPRSPRHLSAEDAREIVENGTGLFRVLNDWLEAEDGKP